MMPHDSAQLQGNASCRFLAVECVAFNIPISFSDMEVSCADGLVGVMRKTTARTRCLCNLLM